MRNFLIGRIKGVKYALRGAWILLKTEASIQVQFVIAIGITVLGFVYKLSTGEWLAQIFAIGLVMGAEGLNTAIEEIADFIHPEYHVKIGRIKDIAAGAVGITALIAVIIASIIYVPRFI